MVSRRQRGFTLIEVTISLAVFGIFIFMLVTLTAEMRGQDKRYPVDFMRHPQVIAVLSRLRRDVIDAFGVNPYPASYGEYTQTDKTLIIYTVQESGFTQTVVWDFSVDGQARRKAYSTGALVSEWVARGVPPLRISPHEIPNRPYGVRVQARDNRGLLAVDQVFQPRAHD